jgi:1,4-dihydroxy-6-naphthoate synthase
MDTAVIKQHIDLYVNEYSVDLGEMGRTAVLRLMDTAIESGLIKDYVQPLWI